MERTKAIEVIRKNWPDASFTQLREALETLIPELKESEDEKVRKFLVNHVSEWIGCIEHDLKISSKDVESEEELAMFKAGLAYLEKKKEQPTDAKSKRVIKTARRVLNNWLDGTDCPDVSGDFAELEYAIREYDGEEKQKEQKPAEWSEADEKRVKQLIYDTEAIRAGYEKRKELLGERFNNELLKDCDEQISWLKSLRPDSYKNCNSRWKPSEEQMGVFWDALSNLKHDGYKNVEIVESIYEQLKKLI